MTQPNAASPTILVTGATGQLGRLVVEQLRAAGARVIAGVRDASKAAAGVEARTLDYDRPETLSAALAGVDRLLLISGNAVGQRVRQHGAVITAAKAAGVKLIAYTSALRADVSPLGLAVEHKATEQLLADSGVPFVVLRNGWYLENFVDRAKAGVQFGQIATCAGQGRFSAATRADFAAGTVVVLTSADGYAGRKLELGGSTGFTMDEFAALAARISGKPVSCRHLDQAGYKAALVQVGLPEFVAEILSNSDASAAGGWLEDNSRTLEKLIGRPTTTVAAVLEGALRG
jgi:NAD(P)H dehydrogenase (quinone)